uniref:Uncharacterized protein n=1 Tax=Podospora anserina (strain S / ATCC MYA-4624 / DSM 980 / FGSC 10383) TaxID=515849 RepID=A0A090CC81_PODAN|nr:Putative protein of unknown function [Podospora anserina S mat+]
MTRANTNIMWFCSMKWLDTKSLRASDGGGDGGGGRTWSQKSRFRGGRRRTNHWTARSSFPDVALHPGIAKLEASPVCSSRRNPCPKGNMRPAGCSPPWTKPPCQQWRPKKLRKRVPSPPRDRLLILNSGSNQRARDFTRETVKDNITSKAPRYTPQSPTAAEGSECPY